MNTTAAALQANVTTNTIRTWCRRGAIAATKTAGRWIIDTTSLAARIAIGKMKRPARPTTLTADTLTAIGGRRWQKNGMDRIYLNDFETVPGLELDHYKSGSISYATLDGQKISNSEASRLATAVDKVYFDVTAGKTYIKWGCSSPRALDRDE